MFRNMFKEFDEDPFFSGFSTRFPHDWDSGFALKDGRRDRRGTQRDVDVYDPFQSMFKHMNKAMTEMHTGMERIGNDPNAHSFSSYSAMSYVNDGKSEPKIFQASSSTRKAPGQIKETRKALRDSEIGLEKMAIGHHIGPRGRIMEKRKHHGKVEEEKKFVEMNENDADEFDREWRSKTKDFVPSIPRRNEIEGKKKGNHRRDVGFKEERSHARPHGPSKSGRNRN